MRRQHERSERAGARCGGAQCQHQFGPGARRPESRSPYPGFNGNVAQALRKYPQYQDIQWRGVPTGESQYHALEVVLERRFSRGLQARLGYTYSRLRNNGAESAQGQRGSTTACRIPRTRSNRLERRRHAARVPGRLHVGDPGSDGTGRARRGLCWAAGTSAGVLRYESGRPLNITMANDLGGLLFNSQKRPNAWSGDRRDGVATSIRHRQLLQPRRLERIRVRSSSATRPERDGHVRGFADLQRGRQHLQGLPADGLGTGIRFETQIGNLFNRTLFCDPDTNWSSATFGTGQHAVQSAAVDSVCVEV